MKLPFVSRAHHEFVVSSLREQLTREIAKTDRAESRLFALLYTRKHAETTQKTIERAVRDERQDRIEKALDANKRTKQPGPHRARLATWADREIERGRPIEEIEEELRTWGTIAAEMEFEDDDEAIAI